MWPFGHDDIMPRAAITSHQFATAAGKVVPLVNAIVCWLLKPVTRQDRLTCWLIAAWVIALYFTAYLKFASTEEAMRRGVAACVFLQASAVLVILYRAWGTWRTAWTALAVLAPAWASEAIGLATGYPFGEYLYSDWLQPQFAGVPLIVPVAYLIMLPVAWAIARCWTGTDRGVYFIGLSALGFTAWDLFMDPQMVSWGFWTWTHPGGWGGYYGIPWTNFLGWVLVSAIITALARPRQLPVSPLLAIYAITWILETLGQFLLWNLPGPGLAGFLCMGCLTGTAWWNVWRKRDRSPDGRATP